MGEHVLSAHNSSVRFANRRFFLGLSAAAIVGASVAAVAGSDILEENESLPENKLTVPSLRYRPAPQAVAIGAAFDRNSPSCYYPFDSPSDYRIVNVFHDQYTVGQRQSVKTLFSIAEKSKTPMISLGLISRAPDGRVVVDRDSDECLTQLDSVAKHVSSLEATVLVRPLIS